MGKVMLEVKDLKTKYVTRLREDVYAVAVSYTHLTLPTMSTV